ncbi:MAG: alpha-L-arabinofuranosidase C-terminal domain-containing protein [Anaerolineae bacterium]
MINTVTLTTSPSRELGTISPMIYGQFIEHFHRVVYGGIYLPGHKLANEQGFRMDVVEALRRIHVPIVRWPGGCFVSAYHWKDGVGLSREPVFDKAWRVEDSNAFGTDEFIAWCRLVGCEPYICTNAGTGSAEEMSDWLEYCNLPSQGKWARQRIHNGIKEPFKVKYWSIGNENWGSHELGAKSAEEWAALVRESAKMMLRVDPSIELLAASILDLNWNTRLLQNAGQYLSWISIHNYWDVANNDGVLSGYEACIARSLGPEQDITRARHLLGSLGFLGRVRVAFDEWNLRGWHHPHFMDRVTYDILGFRDRNDRNSSYTMADAVFSACFLNACIRNADLVGMANSSPAVNSRGLIYADEDGIVLRPTYHVFEMYTNYLGDTALSYQLSQNPEIALWDRDSLLRLPMLDMVATRNRTETALRIGIVNRSPEGEIMIDLESSAPEVRVYSVSGTSKDSFNDKECPGNVTVASCILPVVNGRLQVVLPPHSVSVLVELI